MEKPEKYGIIKSIKLLWQFMDTKERLTFVLTFAFSWVSAIAWMYFNIVPPLVLASLAGEPVKLLFIDLSGFSTVSLVCLLMGIFLLIWVVGMLHYYIIDCFARKMICTVNIKAQDLVLMKRKNLDFGMTEGEANYIIQAATESVYNIIEPVCWNVVTNLLAVVFNLVILFSVDWVVGLCGIAMIAAIFLTIFIRIKIEAPIIEKREQVGAKISNQSLTTIQNLPLITILKSNLEERRQLKILNKTFYKFHKKSTNVMFWYWIVIIAIEGIAIGAAVSLFITRNGVAQAVSAVTMIFTTMADIQSSIEDWGWQIGDIQNFAIKFLNLTQLQPTKKSITAAVQSKNLALYDEQITKVQVEQLRVKLGKFKKAYAGIFESGNLYLLSGQSGCGKTTFINALCGLREVKYGNIIVNDKYHLNSLENFVNKISYMFQNSILFDRSIEYNISYPLHVTNDEAKRLIRKFGMQKLINREAQGKDVRSMLSGGEKKRIDFIRAISKKADIYFLDEPTNELDEKNVSKVIEELQRLKKENKIVIIISHDNRIADIVDQEIFI